MNDKIYEEDLSISYLRAVAAKAEVDVNVKRRDVHSQDVELIRQISTSNCEEFVVNLTIQLKATFSEYTETDTTIKYPLKVKNYNDLRKKCTTPIILGLLILPKEKEEWVNQTATELTLKYCMYWLNLKGAPETENDVSITVEIPKSQVLSSDTIINLMQRIADNGGEI